MFCFLHNLIHVSRSLLILDCPNAVLLMLLFLLMMMLMLLFVYFYYWILSGGPSFVFQDLLPLVLFWEQAFNLLALAFINFIDEFQKPHK